MSILDGSNYLVWKNQMRAWLWSKGLSQITNSNEKKFQELNPSASAAAHEANYKQCMDWDNKDDQAYGIILLWVNPSVAVVANSSLTAKAIWEVLHAAFGTTGPLAIFANFKNAISKKISVANPAIDIMEMYEGFQRLMATTIVIPEVVQAMILLNAMPKEYDGVAQTTLQTMEQSKLMFNYVWDAILMEHSHVKANQLVKQITSKLSAVKQKGTNPKWQPKQQLSDKKDDEESSEKKPHARGCWSGKEVKKHQAKQANNYEEDEAKSLQLTSSTFMAAPAVEGWVGLLAN